MWLRTIGARLAAAYLLPSLAGLFALGLWVDGLARRALEEELGRKVAAVAAVAAAELPADRLGFLRPGDEQTRTYRNLVDRLEAIRAAAELRRLVVFTAEERALVDVGGDASIGATLPELARDRLELARVFSGTRAASEVLFTHEGVTYKAGYAPVVRDGVVVAAVAAEGSADSFAILGEFRRWLLGLGLLAALVLVGISVLFARTLAAPARRLSEAAKRIGSGDLKTRVGAEKSAELGALAAGLEEMRASLQARDRHLRTMLAGIAHEVRNPLGGMELHCGLLLEELEGEKAQRARRIRQEVVRLGGIVAEFLDFAGERPLEPREAEVDSICAEAMELVAPLAAERGVRLEIVAPPLSSLRCDAVQLRAALVNLLRNALQASPREGTVELRCEAHANEVAFAVIDRGPGIGAGLAEQIFEPFFTTREKGTGLGLAFARRIAHAHGGSLAAEDTPGGGATFRLRLPRSARVEAA